MTFDGELHQQGATRIVPLDLSPQLQSIAPATSPIISAYFLRIRPQESLKTNSPATAQLFTLLEVEGKQKVNTCSVLYADSRSALELRRSIK